MFFIPFSWFSTLVRVLLMLVLGRAERDGTISKPERARRLKIFMERIRFMVFWELSEIESGC